MDRNKEKNESVEQPNQEAILVSAAPASAIITTNTNNNSTRPANDDASIESSDSLESWTLVNENEKIENDNGNHIEILKDEEDKETQTNMEQEPQSQDDDDNDDISDGISVISDSESMGRATPHRLGHRLDRDTSPSMDERGNWEGRVDQKLLRRRTTNGIDNLGWQTRRQSSTQGSVPWLTHISRHMYFFMLTMLVLLVGNEIGALIHRLWNNPGKPATTVKDLEIKVIDMELENNLMRAEIDLLNKKVQYLSSLNEPEESKPRKYKTLKEKKRFKAWFGNGNTLKTVDITKEDLKKPYVCEDSSFVEIGNMCIEKRPPNEPSLLDQTGQVMQDQFEQSENVKDFMQAAEQLEGDPNEPHHEAIPNVQAKNKFMNKKYKEAENEPKEVHGRENTHKKYVRPESDSDSEEEDEDEERNQWKTNNLANNSKAKKYGRDNSKERNNKYYDSSDEHDSRERYNKHKRKYEGDRGEWQENYMKHREQHRKQNEEKYQSNKNWYIKRGDSREIKRAGEKQDR